MRITDLLDARSILLDASPKSKSEALDQIVDLMVKSEKINDKEAYRKQVYAREEESTTGIGEGIAIPHGKCDAVTKPGLAAMVVKDGVDFDSLDGEPVTLIFLIAAPNTEDNVHLDDQRRSAEHPHIHTGQLFKHRHFLNLNECQEERQHQAEGENARGKRDRNFYAVRYQRGERG